MPSKNNKNGSTTLNKKQRAVFYEYLERASSQEIHAREPWSFKPQILHGEGRPTITKTQQTFHMAIWKDRDGYYKSHIVIGSRTAGQKVIDNTEIIHGVNEPTLQKVVNEHKRRYGIDVRSPTPSDDGN